jgi:hypothetical protein
MEASEGEVQSAIDALKALDLVFETSGGRVRKFAQNFGKVLGIPSQSVALLTLLLLRGPQTLAELRTHTERLHTFADISAVEGFMHELRDKGHVIELPRAPGAREPRWMHLLSGDIDVTQFATPTAESGERRRVDISLTELASLRMRIDALEQDNAVLKTTVSKLCAELGVAP